MSLIAERRDSPLANELQAATGSRIPLSVIVLTQDEAENIGRCLESVAWADEVIVLDSGSTDGTLERARDARPMVRCYTHPFRDFGDQRNWALQCTSPGHEWILFLDADEVCPRELADAIQRVTAEPAGVSGYYLTCRNYFLGRWIKRCTFYPSWQLRLFRRGHVWFRKEGHGQREVTDGALGYLHEPYDHYGFGKGVTHWVARHNRYSTDEVELIARLKAEPLELRDLLGRGAVPRRRFLKRVAARVGFRPVARFVYTYVLRRGFLDGYPGLLYCLLRAAHEIHITVKVIERERAPAA